VSGVGEGLRDIGLLLFPKLTQLDLTGPFEVFSRVPGARVHLLWKELAPVFADSGLGLIPTTRLADCPPLDVLCVPGGPGVALLVEDEEVLAFLRARAPEVRWLTSVCTGSLVLGAAGLLQGRRAACHWMSREMLRLFGATPVDARTVVDGSVVTGGGVTAGIDFALQLVGEAMGRETAEIIQLAIEYDPAPPFSGGSPRSARPELVQAVREHAAARQADRQKIMEAAAHRLATRAARAAAHGGSS
jgi:cyclohexyl-isocyanide hydratase